MPGDWRKAWRSCRESSWIWPACDDIIVFDYEAPGREDCDFHDAVCERGVKFNAVGGTRFRLVTHYGIEQGDIDYALEAFRQVAGSTRHRGEPKKTPSR